MKKLLLSFIFLMNVAEAFNWNKCQRWNDDNFVYVLPVNYISSTSSFFSSTGSCAMIGKVEHDRKVYFAQNLNEFKKDSARGSGDYIKSYAFLSRCDDKAINELSRVLQRDFVKIYGKELNRSAEETYNSIEDIIKNNPVLNKRCQLKS